jgi:tol-pal system protein YbgF
VIIAFVIIEIGPLSSQENEIPDLLTKINRLERDIRVLSREVYSKNQSKEVISKIKTGPTGITNAGSAYVVRLEDRLSSVKDELQNTTNIIEGITRDVDDLKNKIDTLLNDFGYRLSRIERGLNQNGLLANDNEKLSGLDAQRLPSIPRKAPVQDLTGKTNTIITPNAKKGILGVISETSLNSVKSLDEDTKVYKKKKSLFSNNKVTLKATLLPSGSPDFQYKYAFNLLKQNDFLSAESAFKEFISLHGNHKLISNAFYWLGETYYVRKKYRNAAKTFLNGYQKSPKGSKAPDMLLKLGMSLIQDEKSENACEVFEKLKKDYPEISGNIRQILKRELQRARCK